MGFVIEFWYAKNQLHSTGYVMCDNVNDAAQHAASVLRSRRCSFARILDQSGRHLICTVGRDGTVRESGCVGARRISRSRPNTRLVAGFFASTIAWIAAFALVCISDRPWLNALLILVGMLFGTVSCHLRNLIYSKRLG